MNVHSSHTLWRGTGPVDANLSRTVRDSDLQTDSLTHVTGRWRPFMSKVLFYSKAKTLFIHFFPLTKVRLSRLQSRIVFVS